MGKRWSVEIVYHNRTLGILVVDFRNSAGHSGSVAYKTIDGIDGMDNDWAQENPDYTMVGSNVAFKCISWDRSTPDGGDCDLGMVDDVVGMRLHAEYHTA